MAEAPTLSQEINHNATVVLVPFEDFVQHPTPYRQPISEFLGSSTTRHTASALKRHRCHRRYSVETRLVKRRRIETETSLEELRVLERLVGESEEPAAGCSMSAGR